MPAKMLPDARNLFDRMSAADDETTNCFMQSIIFDKRGGHDYQEGEEKRRQDKEEQMNAFMEIQRRRLDMEVEKQMRMLEMEAEKQAKILEIEVANAKTKAKEVALTSMMTGVEIMKVDLNTVSPRKMPWFEKLQADMLKFDDECSLAASAILSCMSASVLA